jgi:3-isopropylmalate/(R)-2-methylmalate dehydratase small subunit
VEPIKAIRSKIIPLPVNDIDTDQIIPARFMKVTDKNGLIDGLFCNWRYRPDGSLNPDFPMNKPEYEGAKILLAGDNFGCGSSREHAPWALLAGGIRAVISTSFADIFRGNALKNGILPVVVSAKVHQSLMDLTEEAPGAEITIDLERRKIFLPGGQEAEFPVDDFARNCLLRGVDEMDYLRGFLPQVEAFERRREAAVAAGGGGQAQ